MRGDGVYSPGAAPTLSPPDPHAIIAALDQEPFMKHSPSTVGPELAGTLMTPDEFDALTAWEEGYRYELIHGVLVVTPPPLEGERGPNDTLGHWLLTYREQHLEGAALDATLPEHTVRTRLSRRRAD